LVARGGGYESGTAAAQMVQGLLAGGRGLSAAEVLRGDTTLGKAMGWDCVAEEGSMNRILAELGGLAPRKEGDVYTNPRKTRNLLGEDPNRPLLFGQARVDGRVRCRKRWSRGCLPWGDEFRRGQGGRKPMVRGWAAGLWGGFRVFRFVGRSGGGLLVCREREASARCGPGWAVLRCVRGMWA